MRLKPLVAFALTAASFTSVAHASKKNILPDSCGADDVEFKLSPATRTPLSGAPADGKARIIFIESYDKPGMMKTGSLGGGRRS